MRGGGGSLHFNENLEGLKISSNQANPWLVLCFSSKYSLLVTRGFMSAFPVSWGGLLLYINPLGAESLSCIPLFLNHGCWRCHRLKKRWFSLSYHWFSTVVQESLSVSSSELNKTHKLILKNRYSPTECIDCAFVCYFHYFQSPRLIMTLIDWSPRRQMDTTVCLLLLATQGR